MVTFCVEIIDVLRSHIPFSTFQTNLVNQTTKEKQQKIPKSENTKLISGQTFLIIKKTAEVPRIQEVLFVYDYDS